MAPISDNESVKRVIRIVNNEINPLLVAMEIDILLARLLRSNRIGLYESYLLNYEFLKFRRNGYLQPAWGDRVYITNCLELMNQVFMAYILDEDSVKKLYDWAKQAYSICEWNSPHYIMDRYEEYLNANNNPELLLKLLQTRMNYDKLDEENGPYHCESYPYDYYMPEKILLEINQQTSIEPVDKDVSEDIGELIIALNLK
jgi:hypothetical protein